MIAAAPLMQLVEDLKKGVIFGSLHKLNPASVRSRTSQAVHKTRGYSSRHYLRNVSTSCKRCQNRRLIRKAQCETVTEGIGQTPNRRLFCIIGKPEGGTGRTRLMADVAPP